MIRFCNLFNIIPIVELLIPIRLWISDYGIIRIKDSRKEITIYQFPFPSPNGNEEAAALPFRVLHLVYVAQLLHLQQFWYPLVFHL